MRVFFASIVVAASLLLSLASQAGEPGAGEPKAETPAEKPLAGVKEESIPPLFKLEIPGMFAAIALSPNGKTLAVLEPKTEANKSRLRLVASDTGKVIKEVEELAPERVVPQPRLIYSPDGKQLATAVLYDVLLRDAETGAVLKTLESKGAVPDVTHLSFSPDGKHLLVCRNPGLVELWNLADGKQVFAHRIDGNTVAAILPDGKHFVTAEHNNRVRLRDSETGATVAELHAELGVLWDIAVTKNGKQAIIGGEAGAKVLDIDAPLGVVREKFKLPGHGGGLRQIALSGNDVWGATSGYEGSVRLWNLRDSRQTGLLVWPKSKYNVGVAFSADGSQLATCRRIIADDGPSQGMVVELWNSRELTSPEGFLKSVRSAAQKLVTAARDGDQRAYVTLTSAIRGEHKEEALTMLQAVTREQLPPRGHAMLQAAILNLRSETRQPLAVPPAEPKKMGEFVVGAESEIRLLDAEDGKYDELVVKGEKAVRAKGFYLYFSIDDKVAKDLPADGPQKWMLRVRLRESKKASFDLEYDSHLKQGANVEGIWTPTVRKSTGDGGEWREYLLDLPLARFANRQNGGADFRLRAAEGLQLEVNSMTLFATETTPAGNR